MAKRFEKKQTDTKEIKKKEKIIGGVKIVGGVVLTIGASALAFVTKGKFKGPKA